MQLEVDRLETLPPGACGLRLAPLAVLPVATRLSIRRERSPPGQGLPGGWLRGPSSGTAASSRPSDGPSRDQGRGARPRFGDLGSGLALSQSGSAAHSHFQSCGRSGSAGTRTFWCVNQANGTLPLAPRSPARVP